MGISTLEEINRTEHPPAGPASTAMGSDMCFSLPFCRWDWGGRLQQLLTYSSSSGLPQPRTVLVALLCAGAEDKPFCRVAPAWPLTPTPAEDRDGQGRRVGSGTATHGRTSGKESPNLLVASLQHRPARSESLRWTLRGNNNLKLEHGRLFIQTAASPLPLLISKPLGSQP